MLSTRSAVDPIYHAALLALLRATLGDLARRGGRECSSAIRCHHHLLKTFYCGVGGWTDQQLPDGTIVLTAPTEHTYTTKPHGATLFSALAQPTGDLGIPPTSDVPTPIAPQ